MSFFSLDFLKFFGPHCDTVDKTIHLWTLSNDESNFFFRSDYYTLCTLYLTPRSSSCCWGSSSGGPPWRYPPTLMASFGCRTDFEPIHFFGQARNTRLEAMTSFTGSSGAAWNWNENIQVNITHLEINENEFFSKQNYNTKKIRQKWYREV